jgi:hypothetical protein
MPHASSRRTIAAWLISTSISTLVSTSVPTLAAASGMLGAGCGRDGGVADSELGELVIAPKLADHAIDVELASRDAGELARAVALPHRRLAALLGPHRLAITSSFEVSEAGKIVDQLTDELSLDFASPTAWHGTSNNSAEYGRETIFLDGSLYLRARYQRWHQRPPTNDVEPAALADRFYDAGAATWDLLSPSITVTDQGATTSATSPPRAARKIAITSAASPQKPAREALTQRKWRESRTVEGVEGEAVLDATTGAPLRLALRGTVGFMRDGKAYSMRVNVTSAVTSLEAPSISAPDPAEVVQTPVRMHEVDERDKLLERIAPPLRGADRAAPSTPSTPSTPPGKAPEGSSPKPPETSK